MAESTPPLRIPMPVEHEFHHIGYATHSLKRECDFFSLLGYRQVGEFFSDPNQGVKGCFLEGTGPRIELLENLPGAQTLTPWLNAGVRMYHLAYQVNDIDLALDWIRSQRGRIVVPPAPAVAFGGCQICFVMLRTGFMLEFIARTK